MRCGIGPRGGSSDVADRRPSLDVSAGRVRVGPAWPPRSLLGFSAGRASASAGPAPGGRARRSEPRAGPPRRGRLGKTALLEYLHRSARPGVASCGRRASSPRWSCRSPGCISSARRCSTARRAAGPAARRAAHGVRPERRRAAGPLPGRARGAQPAVRGGRGAAAVCVVDDAQWLDRASAQTLGVRRAPAAGGVGRRWSSPCASRATARARRPARAGRRRAGRRRCPRAARRRRPGAAGRAGPRPDRRRDARQPARPARAAARADAGGARRRLRASRTRRRWRAASSRASCGGSSRCPTETQRLLLIAAAEPVGDVTLLWRAAERLGHRRRRGGAGRGRGPDRARRAGAVPPSAVRSAVYRAALAPTARTVHRALAEATDPETDPDRRAWHRAHAAAGPDEAVAAELERSADRAQARGGARGGGRLPRSARPS